MVVWNGLRVRIGIHYGLGEIKLDPVSQGYARGFAAGRSRHRWFRAGASPWAAVVE